MKRGIESRFTVIALTIFFLVMLIISIVYMVFLYNDQTGQTNLIAMNKRMEMSDVAMLKAADQQLNQSIIDLAIITNQSIFALEMITYQNITNLATETSNNFTNVYDVLNTLSNTTILTIAQIEQNITNLDAAVKERLLSVNQVHGDVDGNLGLLPGIGIDISNNNLTNSITVTNTGVLEIQGASPDTAGSVAIVGICSLGVSGGNNSVTIDTCTLETGLNAVDMTVMNQQVQISVIDSTLISQQMQITSIIMAEQQFQEMYNGTIISVNASLTQMMAQIALLQMQVAQLQATQTNFTGAPIGAMLPWGGASNVIPQNFLLCDGTTVSQGTYPDLYTILGCAYCANSTADCNGGTFCLPDLRGKVPVGQLNPDPDGNFGIRGTSVGEAKHSMTLLELVSHTHVVDSGGTHTHDLILNQAEQYVGYAKTGCFVGNQVLGVAVGGANSFWNPENYASGSGCTTYVNGDYAKYPGATYTSSFFPGNGANDVGSAHSHTIQSEGSGQPFNVVQPSLVCGGYLIRAL